MLFFKGTYISIMIRMAQNPVLNAIKRRRSCRFFDSNSKVEDADLERIIESAIWAPSARNLQPLEFIIIKDPESKKVLSDICRQKQPAEAPLNIVVVGDLKRAKDVGDISPHYTTTHIRGLKMFIYMDAAASIQNMLLAAESLGYATLWIASFDDDSLEEHLGMPERFVPLSVISIGKSAKDVPVRPRREISQRLHMERWSPLRQVEKHIQFSKKINELF